MSGIKNYLSLIKFSHTIFAMPFSLIGFVLGVAFLKDSADGAEVSIEPMFYVVTLALVILCMIFARSAAMAFNRYLDRHFDAQNPRTAIREIPSGIIQPQNALMFTAIMSFLFIATTYWINILCFFLSPVALLVILGYSYTKRFTSLCHLVLGLGLSLAPIGAYLAVTGEFAWLPVLFSLTVLCWVSGFDIIYALQDHEFDRAHQLKSIPVWLGVSKALRVSRLLHIVAIGCLIAAGYSGGFGIYYWIGVSVFSFLLIYQHTIVKPGDLSKVNLAFFTTNGIASVVFAVFVIIDKLV